MYLLKRPNRSSLVAGPCCPFSTTKAERVNFSGQSTSKSSPRPFWTFGHEEGRGGRGLRTHEQRAGCFEAEYRLVAVHGWWCFMEKMMTVKGGCCGEAPCPASLRHVRPSFHVVGGKPLCCVVTRGCYFRLYEELGPRRKEKQCVATFRKQSEASQLHFCCFLLLLLLL